MPLPCKGGTRAVNPPKRPPAWPWRARPFPVVSLPGGSFSYRGGRGGELCYLQLCSWGHLCGWQGAAVAASSSSSSSASSSSFSTQPDPRSFAADGSSEHPGKRVQLLPDTAVLVCLHPSFPTHPINPRSSPGCSLRPSFLHFLALHPTCPTTEPLLAKGAAWLVLRDALFPGVCFWVAAEAAAVTQARAWPTPSSFVPCLVHRHELLGQHKSEDRVHPSCRCVASLGMAWEQVSSLLGLKEVELFALFCVNSDPAPPSLLPVRPTGDREGGIPPGSFPLPRDAAVDSQPPFNFVLGFLLCQ